MRKTSLVHAKAHLSELVDAVEHLREHILILRHGKPAAVMVPVDMALPKRPAPKRMSDEDTLRSVQAFVDEFSAAEAQISAVDDIAQGRR